MREILRVAVLLSAQPIGVELMARKRRPRSGQAMRAASAMRQWGFFFFFLFFLLLFLFAKQGCFRQDEEAESMQDCDGWDDAFVGAARNEGIQRR